MPTEIWRVECPAAKNIMMRAAYVSDDDWEAGMKEAIVEPLDGAAILEFMRDILRNKGIYEHLIQRSVCIGNYEITAAEIDAVLAEK